MPLRGLVYGLHVALEGCEDPLMVSTNRSERLWGASLVSHFQMPECLPQKYRQVRGQNLAVFLFVSVFLWCQTHFNSVIGARMG